ncbi:unnamed protein product, partial [Mesorhabditis spiculigera]
MTNLQPNGDTMCGKSVLLWNVDRFDMKTGLKAGKLKDVMADGDVEIACILNAFSPRVKNPAEKAKEIKEKLNNDGGCFDVVMPKLSVFPTDAKKDEALHDDWNDSHPPNMLIVHKKGPNDAELTPQACTVAISQPKQRPRRVSVCWFTYKGVLFVCYHRSDEVVILLCSARFRKWLKSELNKLGKTESVALLGVPAARAIDFQRWQTRHNPHKIQSDDIINFLEFLSAVNLTKSALNSETYMFLTRPNQTVQPHKDVYYQPAGAGSSIRAMNIMLFRFAGTSDELQPMGRSWMLYDPEESSDELYEKTLGRLQNLKLELPVILAKHRVRAPELQRDLEDKLTAIIANIDIKKEEEPDVSEHDSDEDD